MKKIFSIILAPLMTGIVLLLSTQSQAANSAKPIIQIAALPPVFLQLEITSACSDKGAVFRIINRGDKWPRSGFLRLYYADNQSVLSERRIRLGAGQKVSFVVRHKISNGRPVAVWIEPEWYKRDFEYDARLACK